MKSSIIAIVATIFLSGTMAGAEAPDSVRPAHKLRGLEVVGVKNDPSGTAVGAPITRISGAELRRLGVDAVKGVGEIAPNLYMPDYGSRMTSSIYSRGLGARIDQPVVGLSVDNIPYLNKDAYDFSFTDVERIEVLRGARAVLNGRNTMGGQINVYTLSPLRARGFRAQAEYGTGNAARVSAGYYGSVSPQVSMGATAGWGRSDGFWTNEYTGKKTGAENQASARWKTVWRPNEALALTNTAVFGYTKQDGYPYAPVETGVVSYNDTCAYRRTTFADGLTVAWAGKRVVVTSNTSVQYMNSRMDLDQDFTTTEMFTLTQAAKEWAITEDLFTRGTRGKYSWLGGAFLFYRSTDMNAPVTFKNDGIATLIEQHRNDVNPVYPIEWDTRRFTLGSEFDLDVTGAALYHESALRLGKWTLEAGLRLDFEHTTLAYNSRCNTGYTTWHVLPDGSKELYSHTPIKIDDGSRLAKNYLELLPKLSAGFEFAPRHEAYATISRAYKAGGYNTQMFSDVLSQRIMEVMGMTQLYTLDQIVSYAPETSMNYEIGARGATSDGRVSAELTAFFIDCRNQQLTVFPPGSVTGRIMTNAGRTRSLGVELTGAWHVSDNLSLRASYGFTDATFRSYNDGRNDYRGKRVPYAPSHTLFGEVDWRIPALSFHGVTPGLDASVRGAGRIYWNEANTLSQPFYALASASVSFTASRWSLRLWAKNLTGMHYDVFYFMSMSRGFVQHGRPRELGVTLRVNIQ
ncbi:MAG: TonB-dependent receptor [Muribaculaceae bacterium]|nr:TonB-dependent receptor [Muribaculaceae bacterium]